MCFRVTLDQWAPQDLREKMEKGYKASVEFKGIPSNAKICDLTCSIFPFCPFFMSFQGDDGDVGPRGLPGEPVSVSTITQLILFFLSAFVCIFCTVIHN